MDISHIDTTKASYRAASIEEAVEIAHQLKANGEFNWFRGQVLEEWPPVSSLFRIRAAGDAAAFQRVQRRGRMFFEWLAGIPELKYLREPKHWHDFFAIMQHYGIPTDYIDFTTDPGIAGFFAADTKAPPADGLSCIYCLNTEDWMKYWDILRTFDERKGAEVELVEIDVRNLWRLQAQRGVFLKVNYNWHVDYGMFRIAFPYSGYPSFPTREGIYPEDKSALEQLLDQYFDIERSTFVYEEMLELFDGIKARGGSADVTHWREFPKGFYEPAFIDPEAVAALKSWDDQVLSSWELSPDEEYHLALGRTVRLTLKPAETIANTRKSVVFGMKQFLRSDPHSRSKTLSWEFVSLPALLNATELDDTLRRVWNGMRQLPYEDSDIAEACGSVTALLMSEFRREGPHGKQLEALAECFGPGLHVGFANMDNSGSGGYAARESINAALRSDMADLLAPHFKHYAEDIEDLFKIIYNPRLMFEFDKFKELFARELIPTQAVMKRDLILFNPARLRTFGLP